MTMETPARRSTTPARALGVGLLLAIGPGVAAEDRGADPRATLGRGGPSTGIASPGFESDEGWSGLVTRDVAYDAPVEGSRYAVLGVRDGPLEQRTEVVLRPGTRYDVTVWARSVYDDAHTARLAAAAYEDMPAIGTSAGATARLAVRVDGARLASTDVDVSPRALRGDAATSPNDDGANVWVDGGFRVHLGDSVLLQPVARDPIADPWRRLDDPSYDQDSAVGVVDVPGGPRFVLDCFYADDPPVGEPWESFITRRVVAGSAPSLAWGPRELVLSNERPNTGRPDDQLPWVIDPHAFRDAETGRLWMAWGGHDLYVTELDPGTGRAIDASGELVDPDLSGFDPDVLDDPVHTMVVRELPEDALDDPWRRSTYQEGPAIFRHGGFFYYFATYGHLAYDYTIRVGRSTTPRGPYLDRAGTPLLAGGGTMLLGDDTEQLVPGHPHLWEESGIFYLGYDYRTARGPAGEDSDRIGIRRLEWVDGWPTIWRPVTVSVLADEHRPAIGRRLVLSISNVGDPGSVLAVDRVTITPRPSPRAVDREESP